LAGSKAGHTSLRRLEDGNLRGVADERLRRGNARQGDSNPGDMIW